MTVDVGLVSHQHLPPRPTMHHADPHVCGNCGAEARQQQRADQSQVEAPTSNCELTSISITPRIELPPSFWGGSAVSRIQGKRLAVWRKGQQREFAAIRKALEPLNATLRAAVPSPSNARAIAGRVNVALLCAIVDALEWPDVELPLNFVRGFDCIGNIPDSGVFRPI